MSNWKLSKYLCPSNMIAQYSFLQYKDIAVAQTVLKILEIHLHLRFYIGNERRSLCGLAIELGGLAELAISVDDFHSLWQDSGAAEVEKTAA